MSKGTCMVIVGSLNRWSKFFGFFPELFGSTFSIRLAWVFKSVLNINNRRSKIAYFTDEAQHLVKAVIFYLIFGVRIKIRHLFLRASFVTEVLMQATVWLHSAILSASEANWFRILTPLRPRFYSVVSISIQFFYVSILKQKGCLRPYI